MTQPHIYKTKPKIKGKISFVDAYTSALKELFFLGNPAYKKNTLGINQKLIEFIKNPKIKDVWVFYPTKKILVRTVNEAGYFKLRTARNKNLISTKEQKKFRSLSIGIAGLSVGSSVLSALVMSGGPKKIKIADFDNLEITNLNRMRSSLTDIGKNKTDLVANAVWDLDPFASLKLYKNGLTEENIENFLGGKPRLDIFIDEMDSLRLKVKARFLCRTLKIPVLMATDNGDTVVIDIERFDKEPKRKIFHGLLGNITPENFKTINYKQWLSMATKIIGSDYLTPAMQNSLLTVGKNLSAVPQLGTTANMAGAAICFAARQIANKRLLPSGRYVISLEEKLIPGYMSKKQNFLRRKQTQNFNKYFQKL